MILAHSFIPNTSIATLHVHYYSETIPTTAFNQSINQSEFI